MFMQQTFLISDKNKDEDILKTKRIIPTTGGQHP